MSLRLRLALWYGSLTTLVVAFVCAYSYAIHSRTHYDELDRVLHAVAAHVGDELVAAPSHRADVLKAAPLLGAGVRVLDSRGAVLAQSPNGPPTPPIDPSRIFSSASVRPYSLIAALAPSLQMADKVAGRFGVLTGREGGRLRVYIERLSDGSGYLAATMPLVHIDDGVRRFGLFMLLMAFAGGTIAFGAGWLVARRALSPVATLTAAAAAIAKSRQFSERVKDGARRDELGHLAHTFNAMLASLQDAYESQIRFVSSASHELRAPLTVIQANLDLLQAKGMSDDERRTAIAEASAEANRMTRLVADLLLLARADSGVEIRQQLVELDPIVLEVIGEARHLKRDQHLEVIEIAPSVVRGDRDRLKQLFLNLIENAIKYTPALGSVRVGVANRGGEAVVEIHDTGVGISADDLPRVFERFYRADPARSRDPGGSGLGLSIAQWIAREHGGSIHIASRVGVGTTVTVRLPTCA